MPQMPCTLAKSLKSLKDTPAHRIIDPTLYLNTYEVFLHKFIPCSNQNHILVEKLNLDHMQLKHIVITLQ